MKLGKLFYLPSYLTQIYSYGEYQLEIEINDWNVIQDICGIVDSDEEEADSEKTKKKSIDEPLKALRDIEEEDDRSYTSSQP